jgi:hypothetical protein
MGGGGHLGGHSGRRGPGAGGDSGSWDVRAHRQQPGTGGEGGPAVVDGLKEVSMTMRGRGMAAHGDEVGGHRGPSSPVRWWLRSPLEWRMLVTVEA